VQTPNRPERLSYEAGSHSDQKNEKGKP